MSGITVTPAMSAQRVDEIVRSFDLRHLAPDFLANPYPVYAALRTRSPVLQLPDGSWLLTRHEDLVAVYRDATTFSSSKKVEFEPKYRKESALYAHHTTSLVFNDPPAHTQVRKILMGALTRRAIGEMEPGLITLVDRLLDRIEIRQQQGLDTCLIEDFACAIPIEVIGNLLNIPEADRHPLRAWSLAILGALEPTVNAAQLALGNQSVQAFCDYLETLIDQRRKHPGDPEHDVLTRLVFGLTGADGRDSGANTTLNTQELLHNCIFILNAGHETTTNLIGNALISLTEFPDSRHQLLRSLGAATNNEAKTILLDTAVDEFLRFESSNQLGNRRALKDCVVGGVPLPAGSLINLGIGAANRDPAQFPYPEVLDLSRTPNRHLAFGFGIHQCAGLSLARLEGRIAIGRFLERFPDFQLTRSPTRGLRARFRGFLNAPFATGSN